MPRQLIHSSNILSYHVDTHDGVEIISRYYLFTQLIADELTEDRARFLAEPVKNQGHNQINWYSSLTGLVQPFDSLSPDDQRFAREVFEERRDELKELAKKFLASATRNRKLAGELLSRILSQPPERLLYMVGDRPVLAGWGLTPIVDPDALKAPQVRPSPTEALLTEKASWPKASSESAPLEPASLEPAPLETAPLETERAASLNEDQVLLATSEAEITPVADVVAVAPGFSLVKLFLGFLLGVCLWALMFFLFFQGLRTLAGHLINPPSFDVAAFDRNDVEEERLRRELEELKQALNAKLGSCPAPKAPEPQAPEPIAPPAPPPAPPEPRPDPAEEAPSPPKNKPLEIPKEAEENNDYSFMEGCWESKSQGLTSRTTKLPIIVKYCFNAKGNAVVTVNETDRRGQFFQTCSTTAFATFNKGTLVIEQRNGPVCPKDKTNYEKWSMACVPGQGGGAATCDLKQRDAPAITATFDKVS
ncbi:MAG: SrfA family protein [Deltaproteobacteria bacterium]|jgi:hypothetical protein|nr:SrfA family protein [Deltaproteobacteria bacterium]